MEKICNKFKKPTGDPEDLVHDRILCCQWIHQKLLTKSFSVSMDMVSDKDGQSQTGDEDKDEGDDENEEYKEEEDDEVAWATTATYTTTILHVGTIATSRTTTPAAGITFTTTNALIQCLVSVSTAVASGTSIS